MFSKIWTLYKGITPEPRPLKKGTFDSNAAINSEGSGDMSSTQYNQIWSSSNSFFRNRQKFAWFLEHWPEIKYLTSKHARSRWNSLLLHKPGYNSNSRVTSTSCLFWIQNAVNNQRSLNNNNTLIKCHFFSTQKFNLNWKTCKCHHFLWLLIHHLITFHKMV